jgi:hypothetical protein
MRRNLAHAAACAMSAPFMRDQVWGYVWYFLVGHMSGVIVGHYVFLR